MKRDSCRSVIACVSYRVHVSSRIKAGKVKPTDGGNNAILASGDPKCWACHDWTLDGWFWLAGTRVQQEFAQPLHMPEAPAFRSVFLIMGLIDFIFLLSMCVTAIGLLRVKPGAVKFYTSIYTVLVFYVFVPGMFWGAGPIGKSIAAASGVGDLGLAPLIFFPVPFLYGVVSVVLANLAVRKLAAEPGSESLQRRQQT